MCGIDGRVHRNLIIALLAALGAVVSAPAYGKSAKEVFAEVSGGVVVVIAMKPGKIDGRPMPIARKHERSGGTLE